MADALAALGIEPGDRVATVLPNGLPAIVSFLAASIAGTAAPLNPGYRQEEFAFFLEDTSAKILLCPPDGAPEARAAAEGKVPVHSLEMDASGFVRIAGCAERPQVARAFRLTTSHWCCTPAAARAGRSACRSGIATSPRRRTTSCITTRSRPTTWRCARCRCFTSTVWWRRLSRRCCPAAPSWCRPSSTRCRSGERCAIAASPGIRRSRPFTRCCSRAPETSGQLAPKDCASSAHAAPRCRRK